MRDLKYIVKRILIGVGIILVLGFINSGKVFALDDLSSYTGTVSKSAVQSSSVNQLIWERFPESIYQDTYSGDIIYCNNTSTCSIYYISQLNFPYTNIGIVYRTSSSSSSQFKRIFLTNDSQLPTFNYFSNAGSGAWDQVTYNSNTIVIFQGSGSNTTPSTTMRLAYTNEVSTNTSYNYSAYSFASNVEWTYRNNYTPTTPSITIKSFGGVVPEIESLQPHKNIQNGILYSYQFSPKFSNFDTTNYKYQWKLGHDSGWNDFEENEQLLNFRQDGELYVRIVDISDNSVIDNENFVIHGVGQASSSSIFNINFSSTYSTSSDNSSKLGITVEEVKVDITFYPESDNYRYQYKFVPNGTSQSDVIWTTSATTDISYTTTENGTIYARITDSEYNSLFDKTYTINNIGTIGLGFSSESTNDFFSNISNGLNFSGPISSLINIPLKLISAISTGVAGGNTCTDYPLGSLWGTNLVLPCVNIKQHLGNSLYTTIDLIIACCMIYFIIKMFGELYTNLLFMSKNPIHDLGRRGD